MSQGCNTTDCEAHRFVVDTMHELKGVIKELVSGQHSLEKTVMVLTENLEEQKRTNDRIDRMILAQNNKDQLQDVEIRNTRDFTNKAIGSLATVSFGLPVLLFIVGYLIK